MFDRDLPGSKRQAPSQAEIDYVRALIKPLEDALPPRPRDRPRRVFAKRAHMVMTAAQIEEVYRRAACQAPSPAR